MDDSGQREMGLPDLVHCSLLGAKTHEHGIIQPTQLRYPMARITACELPAGALLARYRANGAFTDCYATSVPHRIAQARYVEAFYTTPLFKVERLLLKWFAGRPSTDAEAERLAAGDIATFAAWRVEARQDDQLLLCDLTGRTRSWLMSTPDPTAPTLTTTLYFGSAVVP